MVDGRQRRQWMVVTIAMVVAGWIAVVTTYFVVLPLGGIGSLVTWATVATSWQTVIGVPGVAALCLAIRRLWRPAGGLAALAAAATIVLWVVGVPPTTPREMFARYRPDLVRFANEHPPGDGADLVLPWRLRALSTQDTVSWQCGRVPQRRGSRGCALYLPVWQDWRGETGAGMGYFPTPPDPNVLIATAPGGMGSPALQLAKLAGAAGANHRECSACHR